MFSIPTHCNRQAVTKDRTSFLDVIINEIGDKIKIITNTKVSNINYSNEDVIQITAVQNGTKHLFEADHVISTMSLGILKAKCVPLI